VSRVNGIETTHAEKSPLRYAWLRVTPSERVGDGIRLVSFRLSANTTVKVAQRERGD
jgi:hypothetical protein